MDRTRLSRRALLLGGSALAVAGAAAAQSPGGARYSVEVIVFRQPGDAPPAPTVMTLPEVAGTSRGRVAALAPTDWQLGNLDAGLRRRSGYAVLGHAAWLATVAPNGSVTARLEDFLTGGNIMGAVTVQRGQYLFLRLDLNYATPTGGIHQLSERRRIRFNEKHYFDHPAIGAIAVVSPSAA